MLSALKHTKKSLLNYILLNNSIKVLDAVLANNDDFRRNDDLAELRQVVDSVNEEMKNNSHQSNHKPQPKGYLLGSFIFKSSR